MKKSVTALSALAIAAFVSAAPALAAERVNSQSLTASQAQQLIQQQGSVLLTTGAGQYDRYVANDSHCYRGESAQPAYAPTANASSSFVGYVCAIDYDKS